MGRRLSTPALIWITLVTALGCCAVAFGVRDLAAHSPGSRLALAAFAAAVVIADVKTVVIPAFRVSITVSTVITFGAVLTFGPAAAVLALGSAVADLLRRKAPIKVAFNAGVLALATASSAAVWGGAHPERAAEGMALLNSGHAAAAWMLAAAVFEAVNGAAVVVIVALAEHTSARAVIRGSLSGVAVQMLTLPLLGVLVAVLYQTQPLSLFVLFLPMLAVYYSLRSGEMIRRQTLATIERLSDVVDRRDPATDQHSQRVAVLSELICTEMGLSSDLTEAVMSAARVHDLGKIAVPDSVLHKPGKLTPEEWAVMQRHSDEGADLLGDLHSYGAGIAIIRHHHERWDGRGYPSGLAGDAIPLGARVVAVADTYDAMSSTRAYRGALDEGVVLQEIRDQSGKQFDPRVVDAFFSAMERLRVGASAGQPPAGGEVPMHAAYPVAR